MKCYYCEEEIELDQDYWAFEDEKIIVCEQCLEDYFTEIKEEAKRVNDEYSDIIYELAKDIKIMKEV